MDYKLEGTREGIFLGTLVLQLYLLICNILKVSLAKPGIGTVVSVMGGKGPPADPCPTNRGLSPIKNILKFVYFK